MYCANSKYIVPGFFFYFNYFLGTWTFRKNDFLETHSYQHYIDVDTCLITCQYARPRRCFAEGNEKKKYTMREI